MIALAAFLISSEAPRALGTKVGYEARSKDLGGEISFTQGSIRDPRSSLFVVLRSDGRQLVMHVRALRGIVAGTRRFFHDLHIKTYR